MEKNFNPKEVEQKWSKFWLDNKIFKSQVDESKPSYTVLIPPPNVTGVLHFGHVLNNSLQDFFIRRARKQGYNVNWVPGTDHAAIATEAKVVQMLREKGIKKSDLTREEFLAYCWEWKEKYGGIIIDQLKSIGAGCDWDRQTFTLDDHYYKAVIRVFVDLHKKGYIYKGKRIINWDCEAQTALSNEEVKHDEVGEKSNLYYIHYKYEVGNGHITVATTRPETIFADMAIAVNPKDERYKALLGKKVLIPLINRAIPIIADDYIDIEFGTGCLKVTPAHDINDYEIGLRHNLEVIDILNDNGTLNELCGYPEYVGMDRFIVRKKIKAKLEEAGNLDKIEEIINKVGRSERTNSVVEPKLSLQWYVDMKNLSKKAYDVVMTDEVEFFPKYHKNTFNHWMTNIRDWCISRQLWWGHRIPAWYDTQGNYYVAETIEEAFQQAIIKNSTLKIQDLVQDEDVLDTWASSWLWPMGVFDGFNDQYWNAEIGKIDIASHKELSYYLPSKVVVTGPDIMFLWITRMIIANYEYTDVKPFDKVFFTGMVRDKSGRKMSKSLGNSPDLYELIEKYGIDGIRFGMMSISPAGNDILFDEKSLEIGRNFTNKIWNAIRLVMSWNVDQHVNKENQIVTDWFSAVLQKNINSYHENIDNLRISEALKDLYSFVWDDMCSWYLEMIKPEFDENQNQKPLDAETYNKTLHFFESVLSMLNPIMPFLTEEIWELMRSKREDSDLCSNHLLPEKSEFNSEIISNQLIFSELVTKIREIRNSLKLKNRETVNLSMDSTLYSQVESFLPKIKKLTWTETIDQNTDVNSTNSAVVLGKKIIVHSDKQIDDVDAKKKMTDEVVYIKGFIQSIEAKLNNEKFASNAPEKVLEMERKKLKDGQEKLKQLESNIAQLSKN